MTVADRNLPAKTMLATRVASGVLALAMALPAAAQVAEPVTGPAPPADAAADPAAGDGETADIVVTGSRIRGTAPVGSSVIAVTRADIQASGATTTADLLRQVPQIAAIGINAEGASGAAAPSNISRASAPNLRGIGPTATLTIVDGHRVPTQGTQGQLVDPSFLPPLAIERIEVVADGASAIYGSDAVAGVVNLIPRKTLRGAEVSFRVGAANSYWDYQAGAAVGGGWSSGHAVFAVDHLWNAALTGADRDFVSSDRRRFGGANGLTTNCAAPGTLTIGGTDYRVPAGSGTGLTLGGLSAGQNVCDSAKLAYLLPESERTSLFGYAEQRFGEGVKLFAQAFYSARNSEQFEPFTFNAVAIPATNPFRPTGIAAGTAVAFSGILQDRPFGRTTIETQTYQGIVGGEARIGRFRAQLSGSYGQGRDLTDRQQVNNFYLNQTLADTTPQTALNLFSGTGANNAATIGLVTSGRFTVTGESTLKTIEGTVDGPLFTLPGGDVRIAAGGEYREERLDGTFISSSPVNGQPVQSGSSNSRTVKAVYGELVVPVFGAANALPGLYRLELTGAVRYEKYSDFGSTTNPKFGANWSPVAGLTVRGSYGKSFRAPGLSENDALSSGAGIYQFPAPLANGTLVYAALLAGGNPGLKPETATTWSAGADLAPRGLPGLRVSGTYFNIDYRNQIVDGFGRLFLYLNNPARYSAFVGLAGTAAFQTLRQTFQNSGFTAAPALDFSNPALALVDARRTNVGVVQAEGIDLQASYALETARLGTFTLGANGTYFLTYKTGEAGGVLLESKNQLGFPVEFQLRGSLGWRQDGAAAFVNWNHVGAYRNINSTLVDRIGAYDTIDLDLSYTFAGEVGSFSRDLRIGVNVRNLFDRDPPYADLTNGYDPTYSSALGRIVAVNLSKRW
ncbi:TonB-dependent receptor [Sphingomonas metalli]|uniref:TonB-dependent receptor n=1 Tax=Sphingomonas metalli TaxID=1779358 RepID=A0A916WRC7_9SPHN|nr:TonB-dependent receptor [Sphingomonas metalli]GGB23270.1 TonB-dependent receptor [Sphingomonas metalli]